MVENGGKNKSENSGPLTSLPVDRLTGTDCNTDHSWQYEVVELSLSQWTVRDRIKTDGVKTIFFLYLTTLVVSQRENKITEFADEKT